jgi:hypothetical protein
LLRFSPSGFVVRTQPDDLVGRTFHYQPACLAVVDQYRDTPTLEVEGNFIDLLPGRCVNVLVFENGRVERAFQSCLKKLL